MSTHFIKPNNRAQTHRKLCQISIDELSWNRLKAMKPVEFTSMSKYVTHILEQYSIDIDEASQAKLLTSGHDFLQRLEALERQAGVVPEVNIEEPEEEQSTELLDVDLDTLTVAQLKALGAAYDINLKTKKALMKNLGALQDEQMAEQQAIFEEERENTPIWKTDAELDEYTRNDLRDYANYLDIATGGNKSQLLVRIQEKLTPPKAKKAKGKAKKAKTAAKPKTTKAKKQGKKARKFVMPDMTS